MTFTFMNIIPPMVIITITCAIIQRQHLLMSLLGLEGMILTLILLVSSLEGFSHTYLCVVMLTFGACEASLGLACMVAMSRTYGNDHLSAISLNKC